MKYTYLTNLKLHVYILHVHVLYIHIHVYVLALPLFVGLGQERWWCTTLAFSSGTTPNRLRTSRNVWTLHHDVQQHQHQQQQQQQQFQFQFPHPYVYPQSLFGHAKRTHDEHVIVEDPTLEEDMDMNMNMNMNMWRKRMNLNLNSILDLNNDGKVDAKDLEVLLFSRMETLLLLDRNKLKHKHKLKWKNALDLNHDGKKVDVMMMMMEDLKILWTRFQKSCLDVNGDGKVDLEDAKAALAILALSSAFIVSPLPAHAKGGGGGGVGVGGGSRGGSSSSYGGSSSSSRSYHYHSNYNYYDDRYWRRHWSRDDGPHYPRWTRPNSPEIPNLDPRTCVDLPENGEVIQVLRDEYTGEYAPATVTNVDDGFWCRFTALPHDDDQSAETHSTFRRHWFYDALGLVLYLHTKNDFQEKVHTVESFDEEFNKLPVPTVETIPPESGRFQGESSELFSVVGQDVETKLVFGEDGSILGSGTDSADGDYTVAGNWRKSTYGYRFRWKEVYDDFDVRVYGSSISADPRVFRIEGNFRSSLDIKGSFGMQTILEEDSTPIYEEVNFANKFRRLPKPSLATSPPFSGRFIGRAVEKDGERTIAQDVATDLVFERDGYIAGSGIDSIDGKYNVIGCWKKSEDGYMLRWKEVYDEFDVQVQGEIIDGENPTKKGHQISGTFGSSLQIRGKFDIKLHVGEKEFSNDFE